MRQLSDTVRKIVQLMRKWKFFTSIKAMIERNHSEIVFPEKDGVPFLKADFETNRARTVRSIGYCLSRISKKRLEGSMFDLESFSVCLLRWGSSDPELEKIRLELMKGEHRY